jgi:hypothetical protein
MVDYVGTVGLLNGKVIPMRTSRWIVAITAVAALAAGCATAKSPATATSTPAPGPATSSPLATQPLPPPSASTTGSAHGYGPPWPNTARTAQSSVLGAQLTKITIGRHAAFDRVVFQFSGGLPGYDIRYVNKISTDPKGDLLPLPGTAFLRIVFHSASGQASYHGPGVISPALRTLRQLRLAGDFEGYLSFGAGLSRRAGFNVITLARPDRVVLDIAH